MNLYKIELYSFVICVLLAITGGISVWFEISNILENVLLLSISGILIILAILNLIIKE